MNEQERSAIPAALCGWACEALRGFDPALGLRDSVAATTCPAKAQEAVIQLAQDALWLAGRLGPVES